MLERVQPCVDSLLTVLSVTTTRTLSPMWVAPRAARSVEDVVGKALRGFLPVDSVVVRPLDGLLDPVAFPVVVYGSLGFGDESVVVNQYPAASRKVLIERLERLNC